MNDKDAIKKLIGLLTRYKKRIALILCCVLVSTGMNLCMPLLSRSIMDDGFIGQNRQLLVILVVVSAVVYIANALLNIVNEKIRISIAVQLEYSLTERAFAHLLKIKTDYFNEKNYTEILSVIQTDIGKMVTIADRGMFFMVSQIFSIMGGIVGLIVIDYRMTFLVLLYIPVKYVSMRYFAKRQKKIIDDYITDAQEYARWFGDTVGGIKEVRLFGLDRIKYQEFDQKQMKVLGQRKKLDMNGEWNMGTEAIFMQMLLMLLYIVGANMVFSLQLSIGSVFAFITYSGYVTAPISAILNIGYMFSGIVPSTKRFYGFMDVEEEPEAAEEDVVPVHGDIEIRDVSFAYGTDSPILQHVNVSFPRGSKTALIGKNGCGKSTLIGLLTRMYQPGQGSILLNGQDIDRLPIAEYRNMIAVVSQQVYLFNDTIKNNICLYKEISSEALEQVLDDCSLRELTDKVSLDYKVGRDGAMLSGGQKQKIALARALIHNKPILIFDEATSNTDIYTEVSVYKLLDTKLKDKTVIIVSHKKEVLSLVDKIIYIENGEALAGDYESLSTQEAFRKMISYFDQNVAEHAGNMQA